jgi:hypothetical protein
MGRKAKWTPRVLTQNDCLRGEMIVRRYTTPKNVRVVKAFERFCFLNCLSPEAALQPWIGQMRTDGLEPGTVD